MRRLTLAVLLLAGPSMSSDIRAQAPGSSSAQRVGLPALLAAGKLAVVNRTASKIDGTRPAVHLSAAGGSGVAWIEGAPFSEGTSESGRIPGRGRQLNR